MSSGKRKKLFGVGLDSDEEEEVGPSASGTNAIKREVERFTAENMEPSKIDVLAWWSSQMQVYPWLSKLATKYLAVLASSTPSERAMSKMDLILNKKRMKLTSHHFGILMFLSDTV